MESASHGQKCTAAAVTVLTNEVVTDCIIPPACPEALNDRCTERASTVTSLDGNLPGCINGYSKSRAARLCLNHAIGCYQHASLRRDSRRTTL